MQAHSVSISSSIKVGASQPLLVIAGPCQIESRDHCVRMAKTLKGICSKFPVNLVFKSSFDKANRTSVNGKRGIGLEEGLGILAYVKKETGLPVLTDVHEAQQAKAVAEVVDILQTPAFLCRQTDLLLAVGATGKPVNVKKGQFLDPHDMQHVAEKISSTGNKNILLCERGSCFGYRDLVVDMRGLEIMRRTGYPIIFDATHSVQSMGGANGASGGQREFIAPLARAATAVGIDGIFLECHDNPSQAPSDGPSMLMPDEFERLLSTLCQIHPLTKALA
ncbi:MAG: 3-deoxy-8-phosphooctulonate synthase [Oligoflexia bacterium]|nr:3-deoxy-8-phosphooctulonate synthase [Oligoflexia bacterium]